MNIQAFERIQLALTKVNKKPKRVAQQERRLLDSRFSAAELKKSTMEAEKQKLGLMQKRSEQLANINTLMQRI
jgi:CO/xanthine dehydrogenase FAD-binding subunit